jgi:hypothetical protein
LSFPRIVTEIQKGAQATGSPSSLILPTALPTTLVAAGTPLTSVAQVMASTVSEAVISLLSTPSASATAGGNGGGGGGKRVLTPQQQAVSAYRAKWNGK